MVSSSLCAAVYILNSQNVYSRAEGIADHYCPWAVFSTIRGMDFVFVVVVFGVVTIVVGTAVLCSLSSVCINRRLSRCQAGADKLRPLILFSL